MSRAPLYFSLGAIAVLTLTPVIAYRGTRAPSTDKSLIIVTPHNEQIRSEFSAAFSRWHQEKHGEQVEVAWSTPGGSSEIRQLLVAQYESALRNGQPVGGDADILLGGGSYEFDAMCRPITIGTGATQRSTTILDRCDWMTQAQLDEIYGENAIDGRPLYDPQHHWFGAALSTFGIISNVGELSERSLSTPKVWADLAAPSLFEKVALANPAQSGSVATAFETILQRLGWKRGWQILRRAAANTNQIVGSSSLVPALVAKGESWTGISIDFYGRYQVQAMADAATATGIPSLKRIEFSTPKGESVVDADPVAILRGAPNPELARSFVLFCLSMEGQTLWQLPHGEGKLCGYFRPIEYSLRRMPARRAAYECCETCFIDQMNPFDDQSPLVSDSNFRDFVATIFVPLAISNTDLLRRAWLAIHSHPDYPHHDGIVGSEDVSDPTLKHWLELFDRLPTIEGPNGTTLDLNSPKDLPTIRKGWLKGGFAQDGLWKDPEQPRTIMRRRFNAFFENQYREIIESSESLAALPIQ